MIDTVFVQQVYFLALSMWEIVSDAVAPQPRSFAAASCNALICCCGVLAPLDYLFLDVELVSMCLLTEPYEDCLTEAHGAGQMQCISFLTSYSASPHVPCSAHHNLRGTRKAIRCFRHADLHKT